MNVIIAARYAPLVLLIGLHALPAIDYMKYLPRYNVEGEVTVEEHLVAFYSFAENFNIEYEDVWMRLFVQSLDGEVRKWLRGLPPASIADIEVLGENFIKQWGDRRYYLYYITEFGALKRKNGESISDFTKRFNKIYGRIPDEIKPIKSSAKINYANAFDPQIMQRERRNADYQRVVPPFQNNQIEEMDANIDAMDDTAGIFNVTDHYTNELTQ
jgi:hypothetical protein